jgi:predicted cobalt transporter CbtA
MCLTQDALALRMVGLGASDWLMLATMALTYAPHVLRRPAPAHLTTR